MTKLLQYLKKSAGWIALIFLLLIIQAMADLTLPEYTSDIVNIGIQQSGIERAVPMAIRKDSMDKIILFMDQQDADKVLGQYTLLDRSSLSEEEYDNYVADYPVLETEPVYKLNQIDEKQQQELVSLMSKPMLVVSGIDSDSEEIKAVKEQLAASLPVETTQGEVDLFQILSAMPEQQRGEIRSSINEKFAEMPESIVEQTAVVFLKSEYEALGIDVSQMQNNYILLTGAKMLFLALISMAATISVTFLAARIAASTSRDLRSSVFKKVVGFSNAEFDRFSTASLITRTTNDIQQIQMLLVLMMRIVFYAPIIGVGGILRVLRTNSSMTWVIAVAVVAIFSLVLVLFAVAMPKFTLMQKLIDKLNLVTREILTGLPVIRAFSTQKYEEKRFDLANRDLTKTNLFVNRVMACMMPAMMFIMNCISVLIIWTGAHGVDTGAMQVGDLMAFIQYTMQIIMAFLMISMISIMLPRANVSAKRIAEVLNSDCVIRDPEQPEMFDPSKKGYVEFRDVSFRYPNAEEDVLSHISFVAKPGETTAFIGSTGSGKSTLVNLIPRFYDVTEGEILVDGVDVRKVSQHALREKLGFVPQKGVLFSGTIESNLKYGKKDATDERVKKAAEIAQAEEFISSKQDGYQSEIAQGGNNVSGGQKQRLSIARAIVKQPEIYVFDDSFSALDFKTDVALRRALKPETSESTVLIVAQRISTIMHAEQIIVLDEGAIVGKGTHRELLKSCEVYRQIASSQLSEEELANE